MMGEIGVNSDRVVLHMDMDTFFVSVERLLNRGLKGRPVLVGGLGERSVVSSCSYEARRYGVHSAMPMKLARRLCPDAVVLSGDMEAYSRYSHMVTDIIREQVPVFEKASVDEFYLDLTGMDRFFSCVKWSKELRMRIIRETGLPVSWGLSSNKMVSKIATGEAKPNGEREIIRGGESAFISPMSVSKIPMIGEKTSQSLRQMGVSKVYELREIPEDVLRRMFGETGAELWRRSRGIDFSPVEPYFEQKSVSKERTLQEDSTNPSFLRDVLTVLTERLCYELRGKQKLCSVVTVKLRYSNFDTSTLQERIGYTACDHSLLEKVLRLFERLYDRRLLVRLVGVRFSGLVHGVDQIRLFDETEQRVHLYRAIDKLKDKYGEDSIGRAVGLGLSMRRDPSANSELILPQVV